MIYKYEKARQNLIEWLDLESSDHVREKELFIPDQSKKNTRVWKRIKCKPEEVLYIENELKEYLYFPTAVKDFESEV